jgi:hypothetical protein
MTIQPAAFEAFFYILVILLSLDFVSSSIQVLKGGTQALEKPRLIGLRIIKIISIIDSGGRNRFSYLPFGPRGMAIITMASGILMTVAGLIMLLHI